MGRLRRAWFHRKFRVGDAVICNADAPIRLRYKSGLVASFGVERGDYHVNFGEYSEVVNGVCLSLLSREPSGE